MASGSISLGSAATLWQGRIDWESTTDEDGGVSYVTATVYSWVVGQYGSSYVLPFEGSLTVGGETKSFSFPEQKNYEMEHVTISGVPVYHSTGGETTCSISAYIEATDSHLSMYGKPLSGSQAVTVYDPGDPSPVSVGVSSAYMGQSISISIARAGTGFTHTLEYYFGDMSGVIAVDAATSATWKIPTNLANALYQTDRGKCTIYCYTYNGNGVYVGETSTSFTLIAPSQTVPTFPGSTAAMGSPLAITLNRKSSAYTHNLTYEAAGTTGTIATGAGASCTWNVPLSLAGKIPTETSVTASITCVTWNGTTRVGTETVTITLTVPDNELTKPKASMVLSPESALADAFQGLYIRGRTAVRAEFTASSDYSQIAGFALTVEGKEVAGNPAVSALLSGSGTVTVTGTITDARGYARIITEEISVIAYEKPQAVPYTGESTVVCTRCNTDGTRNPQGQHLLIRAGRLYSSILKEETQLNACALHYRLKEAGAEDYSDWIQLLASDSPERECQVVAENALPELKSYYTVQIRAEDTLGGWSVITVSVAALSLPLHIGQGNRNVAIGKYCDLRRENALEVAYTTYFDTGIGLREIFTEGSWEQGAALGSTVESSDVDAVSRYTLFLAMVEDSPRLVARMGSRLYGGDLSMGLEDGELILLAASAPVTAMYALL